MSRFRIVGLVCALVVAGLGAACWLVFGPYSTEGTLAYQRKHIPTEPQVPGTYQCNAGWGVATLVINADHTFRESFNVAGPRPPVIQGTWSFQTSPTSLSGRAIEFSAFTTLRQSGSTYNANGSFEDVVLERGGGVHIETQADEGVYFCKGCTNMLGDLSGIVGGPPSHT